MKVNTRAPNHEIVRAGAELQSVPDRRVDFDPSNRSRAVVACAAAAIAEIHGRMAGPRIRRRERHSHEVKVERLSVLLAEEGAIDEDNRPAKVGLWRSGTRRGAETEAGDASEN